MKSFLFLIFLLVSFGGKAITLDQVTAPEWFKNRLKAHQKELGIKRDFIFISNQDLPEDAYSLLSTAKAIQITAKNERAFFYGVYDVLRSFGLRHLHPFKVSYHRNFQVKIDENKLKSPWLKKRAFHYHSMHPLELTDFFNGAGPAGPSDLLGFFKTRERYHDLLEWLIHHRNNALQWVPLRNKNWPSFHGSETQYARMKMIVDDAKSLGLEVGVDLPIALVQQNAWSLIADEKDPKKQLKAIEDGLMPFIEMGIDFFSTEMGFSEFTSPDAKTMLLWLNHTTDFLKQYDRQLYTKVHISSNQTTDDFKDPRTGEDLNFNFLPAFANPDLGVKPHTVQVYGLIDPAPTYGNKSFSHMHQFMRDQRGKRPVIWFPETSYWVSHDIDVPLYLPLYAFKRYQDLALIRREEVVEKLPPIDGQMIFSSGPEWGYWLGDIISMEFAYQAPNLGDPYDFKKRLAKTLPIKKEIINSLIELIHFQDEYFVYGGLDEIKSDLTYLSGLAYMQGLDVWDQASELSKKIPFIGSIETQPRRLRYREIAKGGVQRHIYEGHVRELLRTMNDGLIALSRKLPKLHNWVEEEMARGFRFLAYRAKQQYHLYESSFYRKHHEEQSRRHFYLAEYTLKRAQREMSSYQSVYDSRQEWRLMSASWGQNMTVYDFQYFWPAKSLHYWHRDLMLARSLKRNLCEMNLIDPIRTAFLNDNPFWRRFLFPKSCLRVPLKEPIY